VVVLVPIAFRVPAVLVFIPPLMPLTPATLPRIVQFTTLVIAWLLWRPCFSMPRGAHAPHERPDADSGLGLPPEAAALRRKAETLREPLAREAFF